MPSQNANSEIRIQGLPVSPGIARGPVHINGDFFEAPHGYSITEDQIDKEISRFEEALRTTRIQIQQMQDRITAEVGSGDASIFDAHLLVLEDHSILDEVLRKLREEQRNIESIFYRILKRYMDSFQNIGDPYLRERVIDIKDVGRRVIRNLLGTSHIASNCPSHSKSYLLLAHDLTPSDTAAMDRSRVLGFATELGSVTSHTAIIARSLNIPAIVGLHGICTKLKDQQEILLDGYNGLIIISPSPETLAEYQELKEKKGIVKTRLENLRDTASATQDGRTITLSANAEFPDEIPAIKQAGAEGIGLYRTEFLYMNEGLPDETFQTENYLRMIRGVSPHGLIIRTMDVGGDKLSSETYIKSEPNPFLGWRGIRVCLEREDIFKTQLRAILRASAEGKVRIMYPMISGVEEIRKANNVLETCKEELRSEGFNFDEDIEVGCMIEVPSAATTADLLAPEVDFFSIGTNDLIQYTIAVDRVNEKVADLYQPGHPAVLRLIRNVVEAAHRHNIWTGVCGEMAGDLRFTPVMVGLNLEELSVGAPQLPEVKHAIQSLNAAKCTEFVETLFTMDESAKITSACLAMAKEHYGELLS